MYTFFDTETTGIPNYSLDIIDPAQPRVLQFAAIVADEKGNEVARIVGCSSSVIYDAIKNDTVAKAYELSAERFYMLELEKQASKQTTFTAKVSQEVWEALQPWLQQANADYKAFTS